MRFLIKVTPDPASANKAICDGTFESRLQQALAEIKPEAAYFLEENGRRTAILVIEVEKVSEMPRISEPFFLGMNAEVRFHPVMVAEDLRNSDLSGLAKKWARP